MIRLSKQQVDYYTKFILTLPDSAGNEYNTYINVESIFEIEFFLERHHEHITYSIIIHGISTDNGTPVVIGLLNTGNKVQYRYCWLDGCEKIDNVVYIHPVIFMNELSNSEVNSLSDDIYNCLYRRK